MKALGINLAEMNLTRYVDFQVILYTESLHAHIRYGCFGKSNERRDRIDDFSATNEVFIENGAILRNASAKTESRRTLPLEPTQISLNNKTAVLTESNF